jgi:hypothetical protein
MAYTTPKTWSVGDVLTASDMNTYVRDNAAFLKSSVDNVETDVAALRKFVAASPIIAITPNSWNTITHNQDVFSTAIMVQNADYEANAFYVAGVQYINDNSFRFYVVGGSVANGRVCWVIFNV